MRFDVVIVGAGIGGAVLALALGSRGRRVAVVERESAPPLIARPEILWGATPHALDRYGIADAIRDASVHLAGVHIGGERPWLKITGDDFAAAKVDAFSTNPSVTRAIVARAAVATGNVEIHRGVLVEDLLYDGDRRVTGVRAKRGEATLELEAPLVVSDDGERSVVRTRLGIPITLELFPIEFVTAMIPRWPLPPRRVRVWIDPKGSGGIPAAGFIPWPENEGVLLVPLPRDRAEDFFSQSAETFWSALERVTPMAAALREQLVFPRNFRRVARPFGHVQSYVADGAALIGDAAHPMTPAGGQGANAAIWDALALADIADAALRSNDVSRQRLLQYERLRRPSNAESVSFSRIARGAFRAGGFLPLGLVLPILARTINVLGWPKRKVIGSFATTFVHRAGN